MEHNQKFRPTDGVSLKDPTRYPQLVSALVYMTISQSDIAYATHMVSHINSAPRYVHYLVVLPTPVLAWHSYWFIALRFFFRSKASRLPKCFLGR